MPHSRRSSPLPPTLRRLATVLARVAATLLVLAAGGLGAHALWDRYMYSPWTRDARVEADVVTIAPDVSGFVQEIRVHDDQFVHRGDVLFVLDPARYQLALATAEATVATQRATLAMQARMAGRMDRLNNLAASDQQRENARFTAEAAEGAYRAAQAQLETARLDLVRTVVRAPVNGYITNLTLVPGQYASVGTRTMALIDADSFHVRGYFEETKIPFLHPGQRATIRLMGRETALRGTVESISRGITDTDNPAGPELLASVSPTFEWVRLAQRIPVRIRLDAPPSGAPIAAGMTCTVVADVPEPAGRLARLLARLFPPAAAMQGK